MMAIQAAASKNVTILTTINCCSFFFHSLSRLAINKNAGGESEAPIFGQHSIHRGVIQTQNADGKYHARLHHKVAQEERGRRESGVPLQTHDHDRKRSRL